MVGKPRFDTNITLKDRRNVFHNLRTEDFPLIQVFLRESYK